MRENNREEAYISDTEQWSDIRPGETVGELFLRKGIYIDQPCGGTGLCGKCRVIIEGAVPEPTSKEKKLFTEEDLSSGHRLACQAKALPGMTVRVPKQSSAEIKILDTFQDAGAHSAPPGSHDGGGIAIDIGTTTIAAYFVDISTGKTIAAASAINPQTAFGADVISRISYIGDDSGRLEELQKAVVGQTNALIKELGSKTGRFLSAQDKIIIAGNTTMEHILAGVSPESIGRAPFKPQFFSVPEYDALELGIEAEKGVKVKLLPNIYGFVGGDIVSGIIYTGMHRSEELSLLIDIGTNNEIVLGSNEFMFCCSAAAGPALEGAKIKMGMRAAPGAIDSVRTNGTELKITTISDMPPVGICGSGLVDAISELLKAGVITQSGRFASQENITSEKIAQRLTGTTVKDASFALALEGEYGDNPEVSVTQKDIREIQLAKGAIAAGVKILLDVAGKELYDVKKVFLAGAFGNYIDVENAVRLSILPDLPRERIQPVGNSSGAGACLMLMDPLLLEAAEGLIDRVKHIELAGHKDFQDIFVGNMTF